MMGHSVDAEVNSSNTDLMWCIIMMPLQFVRYKILSVV